MVFTGTDREYSVENYLYAITANLILNINKNNKITKTNLRSIKNRKIFLSIYESKIKIYQTKIYIVTTVQENHLRTTPITQGINHHITQVIEEDHQNE